jgi:hypothetical protein
MPYAFHSPHMEGLHAELLAALLASGDLVETEIESLGKMRNHFVDEAA